MGSHMVLVLLLSFSPGSDAKVGRHTAGFPGGSVVKNPPANAEDTGTIPGWGRSPGEGNGKPSSLLAWRIPWAGETGRLQSTGSQKVRHD